MRLNIAEVSEIELTDGTIHGLREPSNQLYLVGVTFLIGLPAMGGTKSGQHYACPPNVGGVPVLSSAVVAHFHAQDARFIVYPPKMEQEHDTALQAGVEQLLINYAHLKA